MQQASVLVELGWAQKYPVKRLQESFICGIIVSVALLQSFVIKRGSAMAKCQICGKGPQFGHSVSHSKKATNRQWKPNIQKVTLVYQGKRQRMNICSRCARTLHKAR
jgi:large subunit ribosomal protein L28